MVTFHDIVKHIDNTEQEIIDAIDTHYQKHRALAELLQIRRRKLKDCQVVAVLIAVIE